MLHSLSIQVKNHMWLFVNCLIENPTFDSQTKENMTLQQKSFGSTSPLSDKFIKQVLMKNHWHCIFYPQRCNHSDFANSSSFTALHRPHPVGLWKVS